jgi:hypothetical protein
MLHSAAGLAFGFTLAMIGALLLALISRVPGLKPRACAPGVRPVPSLTAVAIAGLPAQRAIWRRAARQAARPVRMGG